MKPQLLALDKSVFAPLGEDPSINSEVPRGWVMIFLNMVQQRFRDLKRFAACLQFTQFRQVDCVYKVASTTLLSRPSSSILSATESW